MKNVLLTKDESLGNFLTLEVENLEIEHTAVLADQTGRVLYSMASDVALDQVEISSYESVYLVYENVVVTRSRINRVGIIVSQSIDYTLKAVLEELKKKLAELSASDGTNAQAIADLETSIGTAITALQSVVTAETTARQTADTTHGNLTTGCHGAVATATASKLMIRDASGRCAVVAPSAETDIALKSNVTAEATARTNADTAHANLTTGCHGAVATATASKLMIRDGSGRCAVVAPSAETDIALKSNVTAEATARAQAITALEASISSAITALQGVVDAEISARQTADTTHANLTTGCHGAVATATASKLMIRDASGRCAVVAPSAETDIALKSNVTAEATARGTAISGAIATEVTNRNSAIATETTNRNTALALKANKMTYLGVNSYNLGTMAVGDMKVVNNTDTENNASITMPTGGSYYNSMWGTIKAGGTIVSINSGGNAGFIIRVA